MLCKPSMRIHSWQSEVVLPRTHWYLVLVALSQTENTGKHGKQSVKHTRDAGRFSCYVHAVDIGICINPA